MHNQLNSSSIKASKWPPLLRNGDRVAIVAPSSARVDMQEILMAAIQTLRDWGLEVVLGQHIYDRHYQFAGKDSSRLSDLQWALDDPTIRAIIVSNGGYGSTRIIDALDFTAVQQHPKWLVGFSDITTLLIKMHQLHIVSIHGPSGIHFSKIEQSSSIESLKQLLLYGYSKISAPLNALNRLGETKAPVIGGNLTMICNNIGTSSNLDMRGKTLVIEDVGEYPYRLDRLLVQLKRIGQLQHLKGMVVGTFKNTYINPRKPFAESVENIVEEHIHSYNYPVAFNFPIGHESPNIAFPYGAMSHLQVDDRGSHLTFFN